MDSVTADPPVLALSGPTEIGALGVYGLKRYWSRAMMARRGLPVPASRSTCPAWTPSSTLL